MVQPLWKTLESLNSPGSKLCDADKHVGSLLGSTVGTGTWERKGRGRRFGQRAELGYRAVSAKTLGGALKLGWPFRVALGWD